jgi:small-conductance mechanosensitive channel
MTPLGASVLERAGEQLGSYLPRLAGALAVLVAGIIVAAFVARLVRRTLRSLGADDMAERRGVSDALQLAGLGRSLSGVIAGAVRWTLYAIVAFAVFAVLGPLFLTDPLNRAVLFLPNLLVAGVLLLAGVVLGSAARVPLERSATQMNLALPLGALAQIVIVAVFAVSAAAQIGVSTNVLTGLVAILLGGAVITVALAFGLGGRDAARAVSAGRYVRDTLHVGQLISVAGHEGRIRSIELTATVLDRPDGVAIRVPNGILLEDVVLILEDVEPLEEAPPEEPQPPSAM